MPSLNSPIITGDVSGGLHSTSVDKLKGNAVAATAPTNGQVLTWDGSQWAPAASTGGGGGGANGLTYYLNQGTNADAPTTNLPGTPKQLGRSADASQTTAASGTLTRETWTQFAGFVTESTPQDPGSTDIPAGLWDFNVWLLGVADNNHSNSVRAKVFKYDGSTAPALLATSAAVTIGETAALVGFEVMVPETPMLVTDRIFVTLEAFATHNNHSVTGQFGGNTPSHVHTSLGLVAGTGLWKNVAGTLQSPASLLVDADVDAAAAIAQSKIDGLTTALAAKAAQAQVEIFTTNGTWTKPTGAKVVEVYCIGGGGGGGSGCSSPSGIGAGGGAGGGGGARTFVTIDAGFLGETETVLVATGVAGGASRAAEAGNGSSGTVGNASGFGLWVYASGGGGGGGGTSNTALVSGGFAASRGLFIGGNGGAPSSASGSQTFGNGGIGGNVTAGCGGGSGGGVNAAGTVGNGGTGGFQYMYNGAASGATPVGQNGFSVPANLPYGGSGGGGGNASKTATAMSGGNGGLYGAGGGGGGAGQGVASGAGGASGAGIVVVTTYF
jgi:hypothetical protein